MGDSETYRTAPEQKTDNGDADSIIRLIAYDSEFSEEEVKHCLYAIEKVQTVIHWWRDYWGLEHTDRVSVDLLCVAMQEIIWCKKNKPQVKHDFLNRDNKTVSLLRALSEPEKTDPIVIYTWMIRLENRLCANLGTLNHLKLKREIENVIFEIKRILYSYHSLDDMLFVHSILRNCVENLLINQKQPIECAEEFCTLIKSRVCSMEEKNVLFKFEKADIWNMFREFEYWGKSNVYAQYIASTIVAAYRDCTGNVIEIQYDINLSDQEDMELRNRRITYRIWKDTAVVEFLNYEYVMSEEYEATVNRLGLALFIKE